MAIYVYNPNTIADIELSNMGITVTANSVYNITGARPLSFIAQDTELAARVSNGTLQIAKTISPVTVYNGNVALQILNTGFAPTDIGLGFNNPNGTRVPTVTDDTASGYSVGSLWVYGQQVFSCNDPTVGAAQWYELTQPTALPGIVQNRYYSTPVDSTVTTAAPGGGLLFAVPMQFPAGSTWNRIGCEVTTARTASACRLGIYNNVNGGPGNLILDAGTVSATTIGTKEIVINFTNDNDWFWLCWTTNVTNVAVRTINAAPGAPIFGRTNTSDASIRCVQATFTYAALPSTFPTYSLTVNNPPFLWLRSV